MKHFILIMSLLTCSTAANAFWPFTDTPDPILEYKEKITALETEIAAKSIILNHWQIATGSLGIGCSILLIIGTALGAKTRKHYHESSTRRLGGSTPPTSLNGRSPHLGKATEEGVHTTLAA